MEQATSRAELYDQLIRDLEATLEGIDDDVAAMATVACLVYQRVPGVSFAGFYLRVAPGLLPIGPYQGPLGCLEIPFARGVCGAAARERATRFVSHRVHATASDGTLVPISLVRRADVPEDGTAAALLHGYGVILIHYKNYIGLNAHLMKIFYNEFFIMDSKGMNAQYSKGIPNTGYGCFGISQPCKQIC